MIFCVENNIIITHLTRLGDIVESFRESFSDGVKMCVCVLPVLTDHLKFPQVRGRSILITCPGMGLTAQLGEIEELWETANTHTHRSSRNTRNAPLPSSHCGLHYFIITGWSAADSICLK